MPSTKPLTAIVGLLTLIALAGCGSDAQSLDERQQEVAVAGAEVMPFDLDATTHIFTDTATGGIQDVVADVVYLRLPAGPWLELLKYRRPDGLTPERPGRANTKGIRHLAFRVSDILAKVESLRLAGVEFSSEVSLVPSEQVQYSGTVRKRLVYFHDPEGNLLELCEYSEE